MKNYSRRRAIKGKTAYRSPSRFIAQEAEALKRTKVFKKSSSILNHVTRGM